VHRHEHFELFLQHPPHRILLFFFARAPRIVMDGTGRKVSGTHIKERPKKATSCWFMLTAIGGRPTKPAVCFLPERMRCALLPKERYYMAIHSVDTGRAAASWKFRGGGKMSVTCNVLSQLKVLLTLSKCF